jgi:nitrogen fixation protein NifB
MINNVKMINRSIKNSNLSYIRNVHPCFANEAHGRLGRIHLPVSPICNIQCKFCKRSFNKTENRPGVTSEILSPECALDILNKALGLCPEITVVGVAGPGDPLATDHALQTFRLIDEEYPYLIKCLSTNGLNLYNKAEEIIDIGIKTVTVTVNAIQPDILTKICSHAIVDGKLLRGVEGAKYLISSQIKGVKKVTDLGAIVKINTVIIPGINDQHVEKISRTMAEAGASMMNIIPLIPQYEFSNHRKPNCEELQQVRYDAEKYLEVFKHCKQCRADAVGIPGISEFRNMLYAGQQLAFSHG